MISLNLVSLLLWQSAQIACLAIIVRLVVATVGESRPHLSHALWAIVVIKCVTPPIWSSSAGLFSHAAQHVDREAITEQLQIPLPGFEVGTTAEVAKAQPTSDSQHGGLTASMSVAPLEPIQQGQRQTSRQIATSFAPPATTTSTEQTVFAWLLVIWLSGTLASFGLLLARVVMFLTRLRCVEFNSSPEIVAATDELSRKLGLRRKVRIAVIDGNIGPAVVGLLNPKVLLPRVVVEGKSLDQIRPLIAHELIHVRRGDLWWAGIHELALCVWWFHPLARMAARGLSHAAERSCDQETIAGLRCEPAHYARCLLDVLEHKSSLRAAPAFPGIRPIDITSKRMERIMNTDVLGYRRTPAWIWLLTLLLLVAVLPGAKLARAQEEASGPAIVAPPEESAAKPAKPAIYPHPIANPDDSKPADRSGQGLPNGADQWTVRAYSIQAIRSRLQQSGLDESAAEKRLLEMLPSSAPDKLGREAIIHAEHQETRLGGNEPRKLIQGDKLLVFDSQTIHREIESLLEHGEQYGFAPVRIEAKLLLVPEDAWNDVSKEWSKADAMGSDDRPDTESGETVRTDPQDTQADRTQLRGKSNEAPTLSPLPRRAAPSIARPAARAEDLGGLPTLDIDRRSANNELPPSPVMQASATTFIQQSSSMEIAVLDEDPSANVMKLAPGAKTLSCPQVITINGRAATVEIGQVVQMLAGYRTKEGPDGKSRLIPIHEEVKVGTEMRLKPNIVDGRYVQLEFGLNVSRIRDAVESADPNEKNASAAQANLQALSTSSIESAVSVPLRSTLAIGGLPLVEDGESFRLLCLIRCDSVELNSNQEDRGQNQGPANVKTNEADERNQPDAAKPPRAQEEAGDSAASSASQKTLSFVQGGSIRAVPGTGVMSGLESQFDLLGKQGAKVEISGGISMHQVDGQATLHGHQVQIRWEDGDEIAADQVVLQLHRNVPTRAELRGSFRASIKDHRIQADRALIVGDRLTMEGDVETSSKQFHMSCTRLTLHAGSKIAVKDMELQRLEFQQSSK